jgi:hypothetical protein
MTPSVRPAPEVEPVERAERSLLGFRPGDTLSGAGTPPSDGGVLNGSGLTHPTGIRHRAALARSLQRRQGNAFVQRAVLQARGASDVSDEAVRRALADRSSGRPLDSAVRRDLEPCFGRSIADVRIHAGVGAAELARGLNAEAFTCGRDIYFNTGRYQPDTARGQRLLVHELVHTAQQGEAIQLPKIAAKARDAVVVGRADDPFEHEADRTAEAVLGSPAKAAIRLSTDRSPTIRRGIGDFLESAWSATVSGAEWIGGKVAAGAETAWECAKATGRSIWNVVNLDVNSVADLLGIPEPAEGDPGTLDTILRVIRHPCLMMIPGHSILVGAVVKLEGVRSFLRGAWRIMQDPGLVIDAIKEALGGLVAQIPERARAIVRQAITIGEPFQEHLEGIQRHLEPKLAYLADNWWEVIKEAGWDLLWPWPGVLDDLQQVWPLIKSAASNLWDLKFSKAIDDLLSVWRGVNSLLGRLYGWFFIASVLIGAIIGAYFGGAGAIPGAAAGAALATKVGLVLLISMIAAEAASIRKSVRDLASGDQTGEEKEEDYEQVSQSALILGITGVMFVLGALAARFGRVVISRAARIARGAIRLVLGPRAMAVLENALARIRTKLADIWMRLRQRGKTKLKGSGVTKASYEGPARELHPERFDQIIADLERNGVEIKVSDRGNPWEGAYQPGESGQPGGIRVHRDVDLRTLEHEYKHFLDDKARAHPGLRHYLENPNEMWEMERAAYDREIELVRGDKTLTNGEKAGIIEELEGAKALEWERLMK